MDCILRRRNNTDVDVLTATVISALLSLLHVVHRPEHHHQQHHGDEQLVPMLVVAAFDVFVASVLVVAFVARQQQRVDAF
jgi:hypothetical protein